MLTGHPRLLIPSDFLQRIRHTEWLRRTILPRQVTLTSRKGHETCFRGLLVSPARHAPSKWWSPCRSEPAGQRKGKPYFISPEENGMSCVGSSGSITSGEEISPLLSTPFFAR
ncbi:hypothetical protein HPB49_007394 [Dermacentor silvarum]|uniref:Uncharacterized protein n=1 Tax=Dermacentor silvarum TaxID=543639 RepID=A0ACB8DBK6_DERSI|nr:hypothetical protein HPB49_007394 [Dermacentor silvarum]